MADSPPPARSASSQYLSANRSSPPAPSEASHYLSTADPSEYQTASAASSSEYGGRPYASRQFNASSPSVYFSTDEEYESAASVAPASEGEQSLDDDDDDDDQQDDAGTVTPAARDSMQIQRPLAMSVAALAMKRQSSQTHNPASATTTAAPSSPSLRQRQAQSPPTAASSSPQSSQRPPGPGLVPPQIPQRTSRQSNIQSIASMIRSPTNNNNNNNTTSTPSRTHVPSVASRAFFSPLSSQRLQAHRGARPLSQNLSPITPDRIYTDTDDHSSVTNRNSTGSILTTRTREGQVVTYDLDAMPPITQATNYSDWSAMVAEQATIPPVPKTITPTNTQDTREAPRPEIPDPLPASATAVDAAGATSTPQTTNPPPVPVIPTTLNRPEPPTTQQESQAPTSTFRQPLTRTSTGAINATTTPSKLDSSREPPPQIPASGGIIDLQKDEAGYVSSASSPQVKPLPALPPSTRDREALDLGYNYEYFQGNTIFCFQGALQTAKDKPIVLATGIMVVLPTILFFVFSAPWLSQHVSPAIPVFFAYLFFICISSYLHASLSNPGIFPRNIHPQPPPPSFDPWTPGPPTSQWVMTKSSASPNGAFEVPVKYCKTCNIWRPPRCHHCRVCDSCIDTQDHHCVWLNNCVGRRNYQYFFSFVASASLLGLFLMGASIGQVSAWARQNHTSISDSINHNRVPFAMFLYGIFGFVYPVLLWGYHAFLISTGQTTHEYLNSKKFMKKDQHRPFAQSPWWKNFVVVLMRPRPPSYVDFAAKYNQGDQRFGERHDNGLKNAAAEAIAAIAPKAARVVAPGTEHSITSRPAGGLEMQKLENGNGNGLVTMPYASSFQRPKSKMAVDATPRDEVTEAASPS